MMGINKYKQKRNMSLGAEIDKLEISHPKPDDLKKIADAIKGTMRIKKLIIKKGRLNIV